MIKHLTPNSYIVKEVESLKKSGSLSPDFKKKLDLVCRKYKTVIKRGKSFYRARRYLEEDRFEKYHYPQNYTDCEFFGHDRENSFVNLDSSKVQEGRLNFNGLSYLYGAFDIDTAILETKSKVNTTISVTEIKVMDDLHIVDLCKNGAVGSDEWDTYFLMTLCGRFSDPEYINNTYLLTQHISEYIKNHAQFDGIAYLSAFYRYGTFAETGNGKNITVFNYEKCEPLPSKLYLLEGFEVNYSPIK